MAVTKFQTRATPTERMGDFTRHLREHGIRAGMPETEMGLSALSMIDASNMKEVRLALKSICAVDAEGYKRFDELFDSFWQNSGRQRHDHKRTSERTPNSSSHTNLSELINSSHSDDSGAMDTPDNDNDDGEASASGEGRLIATKVTNKDKADMRDYILPEDQERAEEAARRIAAAIRYRRSRRRKAALRGTGLDLRRIFRKSISTGGEPLQLLRRKRPDRPIHLVTLLDVSGSMQLYARVFLGFIKGLMGADQRTDAFVFHTSLMCVSDALRDNDTLRAVNRLSMMAQGFGGGTKIGKSIESFNSQYASRMVTRRTVVIIMSDGYDTGPSERVGKALAKLKKRGCKIIWLNPLLGWKDYEPVAASMAASLPYIDFFAPCNTLDSLRAIEPELERL